MRFLISSAISALLSATPFVATCAFAVPALPYGVDTGYIIEEHRRIRLSPHVGDTILLSDDTINVCTVDDFGSPKGCTRAAVLTTEHELRLIKEEHGRKLYEIVGRKDLRLVLGKVGRTNDDRLLEIADDKIVRVLRLIKAPALTLQ